MHSKSCDETEKRLKIFSTAIIFNTMSKNFLSESFAWILSLLIGFTTVYLVRFYLIAFKLALGLNKTFLKKNLRVPPINFLFGFAFGKRW